MCLRVFLVGIVGLCLVWGGAMSAQAKPDESVVGKVGVTAKGAIAFDGVVVTVDVLKQKLADLKKQRSGLVLSRSGQGRPSGASDGGHEVDRRQSVADIHVDEARLFRCALAGWNHEAPPWHTSAVVAEATQLRSSRRNDLSASWRVG